MNLNKTGELLKSLRKSKNMTQKEIADKIGVLPKTVSKWETGHGFPDVSTISSIAEILGVSSDTILSGELKTNTEDSGNMKRTKYYVCNNCGSIVQGTGNFGVTCCGKELKALELNKSDERHKIKVEEIENDYYITINHEMTKEHFIEFVSYVTYDKVLTVRLYPEQEAAVRFPKIHGGKIYYCCNKHGLFCNS